MKALLLMAFASCSLLAQESGDGLAIEDLPVSAQQGPSCAFFANLPMVAWTTGYDVGSSPAFVRSVYGLRRGDFTYQKPFDKRIFCELFSLEYEETEIRHPPSIERELLPRAELIVSASFDKALDRGKVLSLRVKGLFGGAHNALLLARQGDRYLVHDPRGGRMLKVSREELAQMILVKPAKEKRSAKSSFVTNYLTVEVPKSPVAPVLPATDFERELKLAIRESQRKTLKQALGRVGDPQSLAQWMESHPEINFAVLKDEDGGLRNVISQELDAGEMAGVLHLSQLALNACQRGTRRLLPVLVLEGRPRVLVGYRAHPSQPQMTEWMVHDGVATEFMPTTTLLEHFKNSGALYGTIGLADDPEP